MNQKPLALIGAPSSAGAFAPGQEKAPQALREIGLMQRLAETGLAVRDHGDIAPPWRWRPDRAHPEAQNADAVLRAVRDAAAKIRQAVAAREIPLVLGGDCTIEPGTVAGHLPASERLGLLYFDLHPDLNVPGRGQRRPGCLDWMGVAHMLGEDEAVQSLSHAGARYPMLANDEVFLFAWGTQHATAFEQEVIARRGLDGLTDDEVARDPEGAAAEALDRLGSKVDRFLVHFDVDVIDFTDAPLSEHTGRNQGLAFDTAFRALSRLLASAKFAGITVTELNPDHGEEDGATLRRFAEALVASLGETRVLARR
jgi:arginase